MLKLTEGKLREQRIKKGKCIVIGCYLCAEKDKRRKRANLYCGKHRYQQQVTNNPCRYYYRHLKSSAKRRDKVFTITYEYFEQWCKDNNFLQGSGRGAGFFTVDRIKDELGYIPGNLQKLEHTQNVKKQYIDKWLQQKYGSGGGQATRAENYDECDWNEVDWIDGEPVPKKQQDFNIEDLPF